MFCVKCGKPNVDIAQFCYSCGQALNPTPTRPPKVRSLGMGMAGGPLTRKQVIGWSSVFVVPILLAIVAGLCGAYDHHEATAARITHPPSMLLCDSEARGIENYQHTVSEGGDMIDFDRAPQVSADGSWRWGFQTVRNEKVVEFVGTTPIASGLGPAKYRGVCVGNTNSESVTVQDVKLISRRVAETTCVNAINHVVCSKREGSVVGNKIEWDASPNLNHKLKWDDSQSDYEDGIDGK